MTLKEKIESDFLVAYKERDDTKVSILRMLKAAIKNAEISAKADLDEKEIIRILRREAKQREESISEFQKGGREDLITINQQDIDVINQYLPVQISENQIRKVVDEVIVELRPSGPSDFGRVIGAVMKKIGADADGALVAEIVRKSLQR